MNYWVIIVLIAVGVAIWLWRRRRVIVEPPLVVEEPAPVGIRLVLTQIKGDPLDAPFNLLLADRLVIGRDRTCDVVVAEDTKVSRRHCELIREGEAVLVRDLGSQNGTMVNGVPIGGAYKLEEDDIIALGNIEYRLSIL